MLCNRLWAMVVGAALTIGCATSEDGHGDASSAPDIAVGDVPIVPIGPVATCDQALFVDAIAEGAWVDLDVAPADGTAGIRDAVNRARDEHPDAPVRVRLAPGHYADTLGSEIFVQRLQRTAATPIWIVASDKRPNATVLDQGLNLLGVAYVAIEGVTIGPATVGTFHGGHHDAPKPLQAAAGVHVSGAAHGGAANGAPGGALDLAVYGQYEPSHHIVIRDLTIQNLFGDEDPSGDHPVGQDNDGIKLNQVQDVWVIHNTVLQTSRHGMDNVGVHNAVFCGNIIAHNGAGFGLEAKGGSVDVVFESNVFVAVRRVTLGGENTDATYYWSADGAYDYEGLRIVARNNLIVDPREAALDFSGCHACAATGNTIVFTAGYVPPLTDDGEANGGDALRSHPSTLIGADDGAGSDCVTWDESQGDYVTVDNCWRVGSHRPAPIGRTLANAGNTLTNNLFVSHGGIWSRSFGSTNPNPASIPCPLNAADGDALPSADYDYWYDGGKDLPLDACAALPEGAHAFGYGAAVADPDLGATTIDGASIAGIVGSVVSALRPAAASPVVGHGLSGAPGAVARDFTGAARPAVWSIGALEP
ncbi:MAG: right-handed parallel beta-helix repeat-containing protein [Myxococcota bacterium]